jgi:hypothetical protein
MKELMANLHEAVVGCLSIDMEKIKLKNEDRVMEFAV